MRFAARYSAAIPGWIFVILALWFVWPATARAAPIDFSLPVPVALEAIPNLDIDGDGRLDVVVSRAVRGSPTGPLYMWVEVRVRLNLGHGNLAPEVISRVDSISPLGYNSGIAAAEDFDGDGHKDLIVQSMTGRESTSGTAVFARNAGGGLFARGVTVGRFNNESVVQAHDFDRDGRPDLVSSGYSAVTTQPAIRVWRNSGNGSFAAPLAFSGSNFDPPLTCADADADGVDDLVLGNAGVYLPGLPGGAFGLPVPWTTAQTCYALIARDIDSDGDTDLLRTLPRGVEVYANDGSGVFAMRTIPCGSQGRPFVGDFNADGALDLVLPDTTAAHLLLAEPDGNYSVQRISNVFSRSDSRFIEALDLDGDGWLDLLLSSPAIGITPVVSSNRTGWTRRNLMPQFGHSPGSYPVVDADADGKPEVYAPVPGGGLATLRFAPDGSGIAPRPFLYSGQGARGMLDADGNGSADYFVGPMTNGFEARSISGGSFTPLGSQLFANLALGYAQDLCFARLDANLEPDVVFARQGGLTCAFDIPAPGATQLDLGAGATPTAVTAGDFDGDGDIDVACNGWLTFVMLFRNDGSGHFAVPRYVEAGTPGRLVAADVDGDGKMDLLTRTLDAVGFLRGRGDATFDAPVNLAVPGDNRQLIALADLSGDSKPDLLAQATDGLRVYLANSGFQFSPPVTLPFSGSFLQVGDLDADRDPDVLAVEGSTIVALRNDGTGHFARENQNTGIELSYFYPTGGDVDGDGRLDLLGATWLFPNRTPNASPVFLTELRAEAGDGTVALRWQVAADARGTLLGLRVERAVAAEGPYAPLAGAVLDPATDSFLDVAPLPQAWYRLVLIRQDGVEVASSPVEGGTTPRGTALLAAWQPERGGPVSVRFRVGSASVPTVVAILDVRGRRIRTLLDGRRPAGEYRLAWDGRDHRGTAVARGLYFVDLRAGAFHQVRKTLLWSR